ncbi:odorant receptor 13a-like [Bombus vosnesenskii]|uniref:Odorant receptor n=1 Tax=Bombus vosnesenskii TaxID=207650 RepID=A0A6J3KMM4_9HYME|nr:odorant receptor 13a-like [Bombus vosnesenskii]
MDSTQYEYLRLNKYLLFTIGIWPYQTTLQRSLVAIVFIPIIVAQVILQGGGMITAITANDIDSLLEGFAPFMISLMCLAKYINFFYNFKQMKRLLDIMREDWEIYKKLRNEYDLLCEQYAIGKKITISFVAFLFGLITPFAAMPLLLNAADALGLCNISDDRPLAFRVEHFVDVDKYYFPLLVHSYIGTLAYTTIVLAINSIIAVYVLHESGLCEVLRFKLENFVESDAMDVKLHANKRDDKWYENARDCVILHKHIIEFANILEDANTTSYLLQIGFNMICVSFTQFQAVINIQENAALAFRYISVTISLLCDLLFVSWPGQQLSDSTERIFEFTTNGKWYLSSINCRKLLMMMLSKSITPLKLTAYKFYTLNLESFSAVRFIFYIDRSLNRRQVILKLNDHSGPYRIIIINTKFYTYIDIDN